MKKWLCILLKKPKLKFYYLSKFLILIKYFNYSNIFLVKNIAKFLKYIKIMNFIIKLKKSNQLFFDPIYSLKLLKLKILKIYIKINFINNFI